MMDILNDLLSAVSAGLDTLYPEVPVFAGLAPDEIPACCFFVDFAGEPLLDKTVWNRHEVSGKLDIAYCSQKTGSELQRELNAVCANLCLNLRSVSYGGITARLSGHQRQVVDRELHILCNFCVHLYRIDNTPLIDTVRIGEKAVRAERNRT